MISHEFLAFFLLFLIFSILPSVQVNIEYGLCEVFGMEAMGYIAPPEDGMWLPDLSELEAMLPAGTIDHSVDPLNQQVYLFMFVHSF